MWYMWFSLLTVTSIITAATGTGLKRTAASRKVIISNALTAIKIPSVLHTIVIQYAVRGRLQSIAFLDLHTGCFSVEPGVNNLSRNCFYIIRHTQDGLIVHCMRVAMKRTAEAVDLQGNTAYRVYQEGDNAYTAIAKKCQVPAQSLVLYTREVPFLYRESPTEGWADNILYGMLWADSVKNISKSDQEYVQAKKQSALFLAPNTTFKDFCTGVTKEYHRCKKMQYIPMLEVFTNDYETTFPKYMSAVQKQSPQQGILLKRKKKFYPNRTEINGQVVESWSQ